MKPTAQFRVWLTGRLKALPPGARLPTDRQLAGTFGLSPTTVRRILKTFRDAERVVRISGRGTFVPGRAARVEPAAPATSAENVVSHILNSIRGGQLRRGQSLPPAKQVVHAFGVSHGTVRAAYEALRRQGHVARVGRRYWVGDFRETLTVETKKEVYLFRDGPGDFQHIFREDWLAQAYQKMERELIANGYFLLFAPNAAFPALVKQWRRQKRAPYGFVFFAIDADRYEAVRPAVRELEPLCERLGRGKPRILLDWRLGTVPHRPHGTWVLSRGNLLTVMARELAAYLHRKRHRTALVFGSGPGSILSLAKLRAEIKHLDERFAFRFVLPAPDRRAGTKRRIMARVRAAMAGSPAMPSIVGKYEPVPPAVLLAETFLVRDYDEAYDRFPDAGVWVVQTDREAEAVLNWAAQAGVRIPRALGLISYENNPHFYHLGLSGCYPDYEQIGHQMAHVIIGDFPVARTSRGFVKANALLVEKLTT
ncbi:MAG: GntR family transcriptional regulator [Kiritimatiellae bacterium]|nr:GntR family transcriptional regulator [Kiritimatiellia bacterium]